MRALRSEPDRALGVGAGLVRDPRHGRGPHPRARVAPADAADDDATVLHVLNRLTYGPRPGDLLAVRSKGLRAFVDEQLHPERLSDFKATEMVKTLATDGLSTAQLLEGYEIPREAKRKAQKLKAEMGENASEDDQREARRKVMREYAAQMEGSPRRVVSELGQAKILRAVYGERQLDEVLVDFWLNHFNVYAQKGPVKFLVAEYERDVLRKHAWGRFEDLLLATAESPAMLFYLDNWLSADPHASRVAGGRRDARAASTRTTPARSWSCTPWAWTAATARRT